MGHSQFRDLVAKARSAPQAPGPITVPSQKARQEPVRNECRHYEVEFLSKELADARREREDLRMAADACDARESKIKSRFEKEQAVHLDSNASGDRQLSALRVEVQENMKRSSQLVLEWSAQLTECIIEQKDSDDKCEQKLEEAEAAAKGANEKAECARRKLEHVRAEAEAC